MHFLLSYGRQRQAAATAGSRSSNSNSSRVKNSQKLLATMRAHYTRELDNVGVKLTISAAAGMMVAIAANARLCNSGGICQAALAQLRPQKKVSTSLNLLSLSSRGFTDDVHLQLQKRKRVESGATYTIANIPTTACAAAAALNI